MSVYIAVPKEDASLSHHGILGQKWGIRRYQNKDGTLTPEGREHYGVGEDFYGKIISKKQKMYRVSTTIEDPTYDNKKYVSTNRKDHKEWQKYIGKGYGARGQATYNVLYMPVKDLKIASAAKLGEKFIKDYCKDPLKANTILQDTEWAAKQLRQDTNDLVTALSYNFAMQTKSGKQFIQDLMSEGYDGIEDKHGQNVSKDPVIIFNPDENLKKKRTTLNRYR